MRFEFCPDCGEKTQLKEIGDEGNIPYCAKCGKPLFDMFSTCVIALVANSDGEIALLRQNYISDKYYNLVSGYIKPGETAEETARREVKEEIGVDVRDMQFAGSFWFAKKEMLMLGFIAETSDKRLTLSKEVDEACWKPAREALGCVHPEGSVSYTLVKKYLQTLSD